jgi:hypothetical protein
VLSKPDRAERQVGAVRLSQPDAGKAAVGYAFVCGLWILFSDWAVESVFGDAGTIFQARAINSGLFVIITALLLYGLLRHVVDRPLAAAGGPTANEEEVIFATDGHREILQTIKTPFFDGAGKVVGVLGIARDVTAQKAAESELRRNYEELQRSNRATVVRELDMIELKQQINAMAFELGRKPVLPMAFLDAENVSGTDGRVATGGKRA